MTLQFSLLDYVKLITAVVIALGGPTVIVIALAKWFGEYLSARMLSGVKNKHEKELEKLKNEYQKELEIKKSELEKTKAQFLRYSEKQFDLYNDLWRVLLRTKMLADELWEKATPGKLPAFSEQIRLTRKAVMDNMLLIEQTHYTKLDKLLESFEEFKFGKVRLVDIRSGETIDEDDAIVTVNEVEESIKINKGTKDRYIKLIMEIGDSFRAQIKG